MRARPLISKVTCIASLAVMIALGQPVAASAAPPGGNDAHRFLTVMTRNLDEGTDFKLLFGATTPSQFAAAAAATYQEVLASKPAERAAAVAAEIERTQPDIVSLQEASLWKTGPLFHPPAESVTVDQLASLMDALAAGGVSYSAIVVVNEIDVEAPTSLGFDVRVIDRDAILVRNEEAPGQLTIGNLQSGHFSTLLTIPTAVGSVTVPRGWASVDATVRGRTVRVVATHLESFSSGVQSAQAAELAAGPAATDLPVVLAGDLNTGPGVTPTYGQLMADGFTDTWGATHPGEPGFTNPLHGEDPFTPFATPDQRIDLILTRGEVEPSADELTGNQLVDLTPSGLWPSDHAGVVATIRVPS